MAEYICETCHTVFEEPITARNRSFTVDGISFDDERECCPWCGSHNFFKAIPCPVCGEPMPEEHVLCEECRKRLDYKFAVFLDTLEDAEVDVLDEALDGRSVREKDLFK